MAVETKRNGSSVGTEYMEYSNSQPGGGYLVRDGLMFVLKIILLIVVMFVMFCCVYSSTSNHSCVAFTRSTLYSLRNMGQFGCRISLLWLSNISFSQPPFFFLMHSSPRWWNTRGRPWVEEMVWTTMKLETVYTRTLKKWRLKTNLPMVR